MTKAFFHRTLTPAVKAAQERYYGRSLPRPGSAGGDTLGADEIAFIEDRDSFYLATVNPEGWPYIQHRGGPRGFLKVLGPAELGFADFRGNRQLLTTGNLQGGARVCLFLMSYPLQRRLKLLGRAEVFGVDEDPALAERLIPPGSEAVTERLFRIRIEAFDWNCPKFITPRFTEEEVAQAVRPLRDRIARLEAELARLKAPAAGGNERAPDPPGSSGGGPAGRDPR